MNGLSGFKWAISMMAIGLLFTSHAFADTAVQTGQTEKTKIYQAWAKTPKTQDFVEARHDTLLDVTSDYQAPFIIKIHSIFHCSITSRFKAVCR